jgi:hypothetical protein
MTHDFTGKLSRGQYLGLQEQKDAPYFRTHLKEETSYKHKPPLHIDPGWWKMLPSQSRSWLISMLYLQNQIDPFSKDFFSSQQSPSLLVVLCLGYIPEIWIALTDLLIFAFRGTVNDIKAAAYIQQGSCWIDDRGIISASHRGQLHPVPQRTRGNEKPQSFPETHTWDSHIWSHNHWQMLL